MTAVDFEGMNSLPRSGWTEAQRGIYKDGLTAFTCGLRNAFAQRARVEGLPSTAHFKIGFALNPLPNCTRKNGCIGSVMPDCSLPNCPPFLRHRLMDPTDGYDYPGLAKCLDYTIMMDYDSAGLAPYGGEASSTSPIGMIAEGVREYAALGVSPSKLVTALPFFAVDYTCRADAPAASCPVQLRADGSRGMFRTISFGEAAWLLRHNSTTGRRSSSNTTGGSPYFVRAELQCQLILRS